MRIWRDHYGDYESDNHTLSVEQPIAITRTDLANRYITHHQISGRSL